MKRKTGISVCAYNIRGSGKWHRLSAKLVFESVSFVAAKTLELCILVANQMEINSPP